MCPNCTFGNVLVEEMVNSIVVHRSYQKKKKTEQLHYICGEAKNYIISNKRDYHVKKTDHLDLLSIAHR